MAQQHTPSQHEPGHDAPAEQDAATDMGEQAPPAADTYDGDVPPDAGADILAPEQRIALLAAEVERLKGEYMRALADAENAKRMAERRIEDNAKYAVSNFAKEMLQVADNLDRALLAAPAERRAENELLKNLAVGIEMTQKTLAAGLQKYGVEKIEARGTPFDPNLHQAVQEVERTDLPTGTVVDVYQDGYLIRDRLLRPAMVTVSRGGPKRDANGTGGGTAGEGGQGSGVNTSA